MSIFNFRRRRNSIDEPPYMQSDITHLKEGFRRLYERDHLELEECIASLSHLINTFEKDFRRVTEVSKHLRAMGILGGFAMIAGLAFAPFSMVASAFVIEKGAALAFFGGIGSVIFNHMRMNQQKKLCQNIKNGLEEFWEKIIPMTDIMKAICQNTNEILSHLKTLKDDVSGLSKIQTGDIGEMSVLMSKTLCLAGILTGIFAPVSLLLDVLSFTEDYMALKDMDNLVENGQISERDIKSKAGKFIFEMRKVIHELQNIMDELKKTKDMIAESERGFLPGILANLKKLF